MCICVWVCVHACMSVCVCVCVCVCMHTCLHAYDRAQPGDQDRADWKYIDVRIPFRKINIINLVCSLQATGGVHLSKPGKQVMVVTG